MLTGPSERRQAARNFAEDACQRTLTFALRGLRRSNQRSCLYCSWLSSWRLSTAAGPASSPTASSCRGSWLPCAARCRRVPRVCRNHLLPRLGPSGPHAVFATNALQPGFILQVLATLSCIRLAMMHALSGRLPSSYIPPQMPSALRRLVTGQAADEQRRGRPRRLACCREMHSDSCVTLRAAGLSTDGWGRGVPYLRHSLTSGGRARLPPPKAAESAIRAGTY